MCSEGNGNVYKMVWMFFLKSGSLHSSASGVTDPREQQGLFWVQDDLSSNVGQVPPKTLGMILSAHSFWKKATLWQKNFFFTNGKELARPSP